MSDFLAAACAAARARVAEAAAAVPLPALVEAARATPPPPGFAAALAGPGTAVIAEVKRASPSRGPIADVPDPGGLAAAYAAGGAAAVSVLTEPRWFHGGLHDLAAVAAAVAVPVLRKDFVVDAYQVWEARAAGAAAVLLIVAALDDETLADLLRTAADAGLDALVEVHDRAEAARAAAGSTHAGAGTARAAAAGPSPRLVVGVNARDLATLTVDDGRFAAVRDALPPGALAVAESGVHGPRDVARLRGLGADAVLVGEHVATAGDPRAAVAALVAAGAVPAAHSPHLETTP